MAILGLLTACEASEPAGPPLADRPSLALPLHELSGLVWREGVLVGVSDAESLAGIMDVARGEAHAVKLPLPHHSQGPQIEGVTVDALGRFWLLEEDPGAIYVVDFTPSVADPAATAELLHTFRLQVPSGDPLASAWAADSNARGEGLALIGGGHVLVAKQRRPVRLVEFGPAGDAARGVPAGAWPTENGTLPSAPETTLVPLAEWAPADDAATAQLVDISDLATTATTETDLWILGGRSHLVARLVRPLAPGAPTFALTAVQALPAPIGGLVFEGLALDDEGAMYLGVDRKRMDPNVAIVPIETP